MFLLIDAELTGQFGCISAQILNRISLIVSVHFVVYAVIDNTIFKTVRYFAILSDFSRSSVLAAVFKKFFSLSFIKLLISCATELGKPSVSEQCTACMFRYPCIVL